MEESSSITLTLSARSSILETHFFPPIELKSTYVLGLTEILTFNSIPNIDDKRNKFYVGEQIIYIPTGSYELTDIESYLKEQLHAKGIIFSLTANNNTLKSVIECSHEIDFRHEDSIGEVLGFSNVLLEANKIHTSFSPVKILKINALQVECNITSGAYINGKKVHTIHEFFPAVPPGYKIIEIPSKIIYLPVTVKSINYLQVKIVDQDGNLVNFRGETITVRLHLKSLKN